LSTKEYKFSICNNNISKTLKEIEEKIGQTKSGVYRFTIILDSVDRFEKEWKTYKDHMAKRKMSGLVIKEVVKKLEENEEYSIIKLFDVRNVPAFNKSNKSKANKANNLEEVTLYVGSAECLFSRAKGHCIDDINNSGQTYSLKLSNFLKVYPDYEIKLFIEELDKDEIREKERGYHDKFLPLLGKR